MLCRSFKTWLADNLQTGASGAHRLANADNARSKRVPIHCVDEHAVHNEPQAVLAHKHNVCPPPSGKGVKLTSSAERSTFGTASAPLTGPSPSLPQMFNMLPSYTQESTGSNHFTATDVALLPLPSLQHVAGLFNKWPTLGTFPPQLLLNVVALLGKPQGGERGIALTPIFYRLWCRIRKPHIADWETTHTGDWDFASRGKRASDSAMLRALVTELHLHEKRPVGAARWDIEQFFDTINPRQLAHAIHRTQYPPTDALLGLQMHLACRDNTLQGAASAGMLVTRSILQGCAQSVPFVRALLFQGLHRIVHRNPALHTTSYADGVPQIATGTWEQVFNTLADTAALFHNCMVRLQLNLSSKSVICTSDPKLTKPLVPHLGQLGISVRPATHARYLGILFNPQTARHTTIQQSRILAATKRLRIIGGLTRITKAARKLATTGAYPQALYGHATCGIAPSALNKLRTRTAMATGLQQTGRCCTTAIPVAYGPHRGPAVRVTMEAVKQWLLLWQAHLHFHLSIRTAWRACVHLLTNHRHPWNLVRGPMAATIATLLQYGWQPAFPEKRAVA